MRCLAIVKNKFARRILINDVLAVSVVNFEGPETVKRLRSKHYRSFSRKLFAALVVKFVRKARIPELRLVLEPEEMLHRMCQPIVHLVHVILLYPKLQLIVVIEKFLEPDVRFYAAVKLNREGGTNSMLFFLA